MDKVGERRLGSGLIISYVPQKTDFLQGKVEDYIQNAGIEASLFFAVLRKLDFERSRFDQPIECYSVGQKKRLRWREACVSERTCTAGSVRKLL